tara:strand:+ start:3118 stop:3726 length:609 start_codon:yes stop_codon:yes gene_type:complete
MKSVYSFIVSPKGDRYNNKKKIGESELIINTEIFNHQYINREAEVIATPSALKTEIKVGDTILIHHNVFRRWHNQHGIEKNSRSYISENLYAVDPMQVYMYKNDNEWKPLKGYCFVKPIKSNNIFNNNSSRGHVNEVPNMGVIKYTDGSLKKDELVGFTPKSEFEFVVDGQRLYRIRTEDITIKYEYQGNEEEYNPSWAESS